MTNKYPFKIIKRKAGTKFNNLSPDLNLKASPNNIKRDKPPDEMINIVSNFRPTSKPIPPHISRIPVSVANFSSPNFLNSFFIFTEVKQTTPYIKNERAESKTNAVFKKAIIG
jgi:hypothetical protein